MFRTLTYNVMFHAYARIFTALEYVPGGIRRPLDVEWMSIWCPSVHRKHGTSGGRPNSAHYGRPLDIPIGRPTDVHLRLIQRRHVYKFISWTISSLIYFEVLRTKNFKYFFWIWKCGFWKCTKGYPEKRGKRPINSSTAF